jgi:hypothetical protein
MKSGARLMAMESVSFRMMVACGLLGLAITEARESANAFRAVLHGSRFDTALLLKQRKLRPRGARSDGVL